MRTVFRVLSVACLLAIGGCGSSVRISETPEWKASLSAKTQVEMMTKQRDATYKYDSDWDNLDAAMWSTVIAAAEQYDKKQISWNQYQAITNDALAVRTSRRKAIAAAEDAAYYARRAATRSYSCSTYRGSTTCY